jgi:hypothetical protein
MSHECCFVLTRQSHFDYRTHGMGTSAHVATAKRAHWVTGPGSVRGQQPRLPSADGWATSTFRNTAPAGARPPGKAIFRESVDGPKIASCYTAKHSCLI